MDVSHQDEEYSARVLAGALRGELELLEEACG